MTEILPVESEADIAAVARLAHEIWNEHYVAIIGQAQVNYMVAKFQSVDAIARQIVGGLEYFSLLIDGMPQGYLAIESQPADRALFLSKLYVRKALRGRGAARDALVFIDAACRRDRLPTIWLTVNKRNPAVAAHERLGFRIVGEVVTDIGNGFVMDDFRMERLVVPAGP